jgi:hypothetical protein
MKPQTFMFALMLRALIRIYFDAHGTQQQD